MKMMMRPRSQNSNYRSLNFRRNDASRNRRRETLLRRCHHWRRYRSHVDFLREAKLTETIGWYGLTAANNYIKLQPSTKLAIFDKYGTVGGTWSKDRIYPNLVAQVEYGYFVRRSS